MMINIRKVIDGKVYDTSTAKLVLRIQLGNGGHDAQNEVSGLFVTQKGQWFLAGNDGPLSSWHDVVGKSCIAGKGLRLITPKEAQEFLQEHDAPVEDYFETEQG